jgi:hypothetical protein
MTLLEELTTLDTRLLAAKRLPDRGARESLHGKKALILDSTQIDAYINCPTAWKLGYVDNLERAEAETRTAMVMGTLGHKMLELYYKARALGSSWGEAKDLALSYTPEESFPLGAIDRETVRKSFDLYTYTYVNNDIAADSPDSVEVGFSTKLYEDHSWIFILEGRVDRIGQLGGQPTWCDHKFQMRKKNLYHESIQFRNYALATGMTLGFVNYIRFAKEVTKDTFVRSTLSFTKPKLDWWKKELIAIYTSIAKSIETDSFPQHWSACSGRFNYPCEFTPLCEELNPYVRENQKKMLYQIKEEWKPW